MNTKENKLGEQAMIIIADYPLYASTCGITYEEAIAIVKVLAPVSEWAEWIKEIQNA